MIYKNKEKKIIFFFPGLENDTFCNAIKMYSLFGFFTEMHKDNKEIGKTFIGSSSFKNAKVCKVINSNWKIIIGL